MTETNNLHLPQWEAEDRIMHGDFNDAFAKIDAAIAENAAAVAKCGNCRLVYGSYVGNGQYGSDHPNTLHFDAKPLLLLVSGNYQFFAVHGTEVAMAYAQSMQDTTIYFSWGDAQVSWYQPETANKQLNINGFTYYYVALLAAE